MRSIFLVLCLIATTFVYSQKKDTTPELLSAVEVKAYGEVRKFQKVPAAVSFANTQVFNQFSPAAIVSAINTLPGVRMEERSPGSYRFNIRGSSQRSPFGVRNLKVYYNDIPFTDPGGTTYLNGLGAANFSSVEVLKGPGSSLYGAGTGGVLLVEALQPSEQPLFLASYTAGSFGLHQATATANTGSEAFQNKITYQLQQSDGYRQQSALRRDVLTWTGSFRWRPSQVLKTTFLYSDLFYQTPGALTRLEYDNNPRSSRPGSGSFPGAVQSHAAIYQKTFLAGASFIQDLNTNFKHQVIAYGSFTELRNPSIRNYGKETLPHVGGRTSLTGTLHWGSAIVTTTLGAEWQQGFSTASVFKNKNGLADSLQTEDETSIRQAFAFLQANVKVQQWEFTAGASLNQSKLAFQRLVPAPQPRQNKTLNNQLAPRFSVARQWNRFTIYSSVSKGFSPPSTAELLPTGSQVNLSLQAEEGTNYDLGLRGNGPGRLFIDVNTFYFRLKNTIVLRRDAGGGDYYVNSGRTAQRGVETSLRYGLGEVKNLWQHGNLWLSHTFHSFRYTTFTQLSNDYSGKALPGVAPHILSAGMEWSARSGVFGNFTCYFNSKTPLNDANTAYAEAFHLLGAKIGLIKKIGNSIQLQVSAGIDNLLNQQYSLGNDINGFGGRYFNAAAGRNVFTSLILQRSVQQKALR